MRALRETLLLVALAVVCPSISCDRPRVEGPGRSYEFIVLEVKGQSLSVEVAADAQARTLGLMHREHMDENKGMIFIFNAPSIQKFWMRNTLIALSIAFLDDSGRILQIEDMKPKDERRTVSKDKVRYVLEMNQGWFERHGVTVGDIFVDFQEKVARYRG
tara:strand:+ start:326 stop:805 length:480 start_codon:yes stop_codon:yes gene_type:complete